MIRARVREPAVLVVGGDDTMSRCAEIASPVKVVRARRVDAAIARARLLRPLAVVVDRSVAPLAADQIAREIPAPVVTTSADDDDLHEQLAPVLAQRR
jgi:hypothetical protein